MTVAVMAAGKEYSGHVSVACMILAHRCLTSMTSACGVFEKSRHDDLE